MEGVPPDVSIGASESDLESISMASISMADQEAGEGMGETGDGVLGSGINTSGEVDDWLWREELDTASETGRERGTISLSTRSATATARQRKSVLTTCEGRLAMTSLKRLVSPCGTSSPIRGSEMNLPLRARFLSGTSRRRTRLGGAWRAGL
jgi:hypothetical protein